jgi:DNA gyrase subunit A
MLSSSGLLARTTGTALPGTGGNRAKHDVVISTVRATARGQVGAVTTRGRLLKLDVLDLPALPATANAPHLQGGAPVSEFLSLDGGERVIALAAFDPDSPGLALGTRHGVVKRVNPEYLANKDSWEVIRLAEGDELVGAVDLASGDAELCFVTSDAQLLHFPAAGVRPQGRAGGGMAGVRLASGQSTVFFGAVSGTDEAVVVTVSGASSALPGTEPGSVKVTRFAEYPGKGRGTGGVRCHRFLKGEDTLVFAWVGTEPARAAAASGAPVDLPDPTGRRDGSGVPAAQPILACAGPVQAMLASA